MHSDAGSLLVETGTITEAQLQHAMMVAVQYSGTLVQNLIRLGYITDQQLAFTLASKLKLPMAEQSQFDNLPAFITRLVPSDIVIAHRLTPIMLYEGVLYVAMTDPTNRAALEEISFATGYKTSPVVASYELVETAMFRYYGIPPEDKSFPEEALAALPSLEDEQISKQPLVSHLSLPGPSELPSDTARAGLVRTEPSNLEGTVSAFDQALRPDQVTPEVPRETTSLGQTQQNEAVASNIEELGDLFFGLGQGDAGIVYLTRKKKAKIEQGAGTIAEAIQSQMGVLETVLAKPRDLPQSPIEEAEETSQTGRTERVEPSDLSKEPPGDDTLQPLLDVETARIKMGEAEDPGEVAHILVRFALAYLPRVVLFIVRKDILVGWMGRVPGILNRQIKSIMIPLNSPSVFRTVKEQETDYFGKLPKTIVNDTFISILGDFRPAQVLLVPITVRHKSICIIYGDCGKSASFKRDLSPIHLFISDVSAAFERIIIRMKSSRRAIR